jgi:FtsZ-binding cell division protein ZapB
VKNILVATAVAAALSYLPAAGYAQTSSPELGQIREQLQSLMQRVDKLEQENSSLKQENDNLKSQTEYLRSEARGLRKDAAEEAANVAKVKGADWAGRLSFAGDVRYRYEAISDETLALSNGTLGQAAADRYRDRIRLRLNATAKATDTITVGLGIATSEGNDPRSSNQSLTGQFSRKSLFLDTAFFDWKFANWGDLIGGKMKQPFFKPGQSLFWDNDVNPEGLAVAFNRGQWFGSGYYYWLNEISGHEATTTSDIALVGWQSGVRLPIGASNLVIAAHYYDLRGGEGRAPFFSGANGNTTIGPSTAPVLLHDYNVGELSAEFNTNVGAFPLQLWAQYAKNEASDVDDLDTAWAAGVLFGKASNYRTWEVGAMYQVVEKDALFAQLMDSDFANGVSDSEGWVLRAGYAPVKNWTLNATYFLTERNMDVANSSVAGLPQSGIDYDRLQVDFNVKF